MRNTHLLGLALTLSLTAAIADATAQPPLPLQPSAVQDESYDQPDGSRALAQSVVVRASPAEVWEAFTTAEGFTAWAVPVARIDLRLGGLIETTYQPGGALGGPDTIANQIIAYAPLRMLAFRNVVTPEGAPFDGEMFRKLHTVVLIDPQADGRTKVTLVQPNHGRTGAAATLYDFFAEGNRWSLEQLKTRFEAGPANWRAGQASAPPNGD